MSPERLETYLRRNKTLPVDREQLLDELSKVRETGTGFNIGASIADHISIASPIMNGKAPATLAIAVVGPKSRMEEKMDQIATSVHKTAASLSFPNRV